MLSNSAVHAIRATIALASLPENTFEGSPAIARRVGAPPNYLGKLLQSLAREGIVVSQKGLHGGWALGRDAAKISLADVVAPIEDVSRWRACFLGRSDCSDADPCHVHEAWAPVRDRFLEFMEGTTLQELVERGGVARLESFLEPR